MRISQGSSGADSADRADRADRAAQRLAQLAAAIEGRPPVAEDAEARHGPDLTAPRWDDLTRVRAAPEEQAAEPTVVPEPGRHATRRRETDLRGAVRSRWPGIAVVGAQHLAVLALAVAVVIGGTAWWLLRDHGSVVPVAMASSSPLAPADASPAALEPAAPTGATSTATSAASVTVDVVGKVRHPGIAVLRPGARVVDAIRAAGGARRGVDLSSLNLARPLVDGEQIAVGVAGAGPSPGVGGGAAGASAAPGALVNLNTATQEQLEALPEVGPVTAQAILAYREQNGGFTSVDQLLDVQGIGDKTMAQLEPYVTV
ncbi:hypothetical protein GCM10028801_23590 [Nocardioides maradonensis]